jgi:hypothetical protein
MTEIGSINVYRLLKYGGKIVDAELVVQIDENGNTVLSLGGKEDAGGIAIYLDVRARQDLLRDLGKIKFAWAQRREGAGLSEQQLDTISSSPIPGVANTVRLSSLPRQYGQQRLCLIEMSGYARSTVLTTVVGKPDERLAVRLLLPPAAVDNLIELAEQAAALQS